MKAKVPVPSESLPPMPATLTWLSHSCFTLVADGHKLIVDPFLDGNDKAPINASAVEADLILLTHGHFDHVADAAPIAKRTGATVIANYEVTEWLKRQGVAEAQVAPMNPGGARTLPFGRVRLTIAHHSSSMPDGSNGGVACGVVLETAGQRIYFAGDTALFLDMKLIGVGGLDLAVLPIGDVFTMGPEDSIEAVKFLNPRRVAPCHYNTWPDIEQDAQAWAETVKRQTAAEPIVLTPGESVTL